MAKAEVTVVTYSCDLCGTTSDKPLRGDGRMAIDVDVFGIDGCAWGRDSRRYDLCLGCVGKVHKAIENIKAEVQQVTCGS